MDQITIQLTLNLVGGWFQHELPIKRKFIKRFFGPAPLIYDWVEWLYGHLTVTLNQFYVAWKHAEEMTRGAVFVYRDILTIPVTRRSKNDRKWLTHYHVMKARARLKKAQWKYRNKKWGWLQNAQANA